KFPLKSSLSTLSTDSQDFLIPADVIGANSLLDDNIEGAGIKIAILDTGINKDHPDLSNVISDVSFVKTTLGYYSDEEPDDLQGHGTAVAGIAAGTGEASQGQISGVAPKAALLNIKCMDEFGVGTDAGLLAAIDYAVNNTDADIISMSLGTEGDVNSILSFAADAAVDAGRTVVVAAGNSGPNWYTIGTPAAAKKVISVGASSFNGTAVEFSSRGPTSDFRVGPHILAPGDGILCPLSPGSQMETALEIMINDYILDGDGGNYVGLSGTSMATPVVSGAIALLMQKFSEVTTRPHVLRAAIQQSAKDMNDPPYIQGAGFLDVTSASNLLSQGQSTSNRSQFDVVSILPSSLDFNPLIPQFPGTSIERRISITTGKPMKLTMDIVSSDNLSIEIINESSIEPIDGYSELIVNLTIPFNATAGVHPVEIQLSLNNHDFSLESSITVSYPKARVYWDLWHDSSGDSLERTYIGLTNLTTYLDIQIIEHNGSIRPEMLSGYPLVILGDSEIIFSPAEIATLQNYLQFGGNLLVMGSTYPLFNLNSFNDLLQPYGIQFENTSHFDLYDRGVDQEITAKNENKNLILEDHEVFSNISKLSWTKGASLSLSGEANPLAYLSTNETVIATSQTLGGGKILVLGSDYYLTDLEFETSFSDKANLTKNIFNWLLDGEIPSVVLETSSQSRNFKPGDLVTINTWISSDQAGIDYFNSLDASVALPNGTTQDLQIFESSYGNYHFSFLLPNSSSILQGDYIFNLEFTNHSISSLIIRSSWGFPEVISKGDQVTFSPLNIEEDWADWIDTVNTSKVMVDGIISFDVTLFDADSDPENISATIYLMLDPSFTFSLNEILSFDKLTHKSLPLTYDAVSGNWTAAWTVPRNASPGFYRYYIEVNDEADNYSVNTTEAAGTFIIVSRPPQIDEENSVVGEKSLDYYKTGAKIPSYSFDSNLKFEIVGSDPDSENLTCVIAILHWEVYWVIDIVLDTFSLEYKNGKFTGSYSLPSSSRIPTYTGYGDIKIDNEPLYIFIFLRDEQGNYDGRIAALVLTSSFSLTPYYLILMIFLILGALGLLYFVQKRRMRRGIESAYYQYQQRPVVAYRPPMPSIRYCYNCGKPLENPNQNFCTDCGTKF
ncbi:MAG: S8 family serine peptidase, partial [Promethearchaeota archaeon]